ncbi:MAG: T9SS type A sorting domain-containing protein [Candidatus Marinimicrobia bacterium]|nr:T9SS type A sorting domain-containing protein [Candidatus Neomarinimicrobiota bacterium]
MPRVWRFTVSGQVGIKATRSLLYAYARNQNYPNPFNPITTIKYDIPKTSQVTLTIYDMNGQVVERLVIQTQEPGFYSVNWDARNVSTGMYFYRVQADGFSAVKKCLLNSQECNSIPKSPIFNNRAFSFTVPTLIFYQDFDL